MSAILAIGTTQGVYVLGETPTDWKLLGQGLAGRCVTCLEATNSGQFWAGTSQSGIAVSSNLEEWKPIVNDLSGKGVYSLLFHPKQAGVVLVGTSPASIYLSLDGGKSLKELSSLRKLPSASHWSFPEPPYQSRLNRLYFHPSNLDTIYASVLSGGVYISNDVGHTWQDRSKVVGRIIHDLRGHSLLPGRLYATTPIGFYLSEDMGQHWVERNHGLAYLHMGGLEVHPDEPNICFVAAHRSAEGGGAVYRSPDAGQHWDTCEGLAFSAQLRYTSLVLSKDRLLVGTNQGDIYMSRDLGSSWGKVRSALPPILCMTLVTV